MTPNELGSYLFYELLVVPVAWSGSDLPIGDTPIATLIKVPFVFFVGVFFSAYIIRLLLKPVDVLLHKLRRREYYFDDNWDVWTAMTALWGSIIIVLAVWAFFATWFNS